MNGSTRFLLLVVAGLLAVVPACTVFEDDDASQGPSLLVYATDAPGDVTLLEVELIDVRVFVDRADGEGLVLPPEGQSSVVDLVEAADSGTPGLLNAFGIPAGTYQCAEGTLQLGNVTIRDDQDQDVSCTSVTNIPTSFSTTRLCLSRPITVGGEGNADVVFDLPVLRGTVDPDSGACVLEFDHGRSRLMRFAEF